MNREEYILQNCQCGRLVDNCHECICIDEDGYDLNGYNDEGLYKYRFDINGVEDPEYIYHVDGIINTQYQGGSMNRIASNTGDYSYDIRGNRRPYEN